MIQVDINQIQANGDTYFSSMDTGYLMFLIIGIIGYFTVPSIANYIVNAGGAGALLFKSTRIFSSGTRAIVRTTTAGMGVASDALVSGATRMNESISSFGSADWETGKTNTHMKDKITGTKS